ncbi:hypothetical protein LXD69_11290 [Flavobacterium sediminilitoris]|uniref:Lipoprotein n=1 Tax=Flavobacterium sediminilitoris TaxID=2024526 RepID=A0ABY4HJX7_9FLAO|nr:MULTISPECIES: hypothetical protein [Flavobacterium]UOX32627.1 hypothetical protein LXD69_11290 [Flavobacterium sediminilitoris]
MKNLKVILGFATIAIGITSCKNEKQEIAQNKIDEYIMYVDSISAIETSETIQDWDKIQANYDVKKMNAENATSELENKSDVEATLNESTLKYEEYKAKAIMNKAEIEEENFKKSLFGEEIIGKDKTFSWVNKDNIAAIYERFVTTVDKNKDSYSREDWDEIKLLYEALDTRKNTVENEGLSSEDNKKIAALKIKFAPMYTVNRMGAKSDENAEAKE